MMTINHYNWIGSSLNILKKLHDKDSPIVCSENHAWVILTNIKRLIGDKFICIEKGMLMSAEVMFCHKLIDI
jgi:hypothetical protein